MTVIVDTGVLYADHDTDASRHEVASRALDSVYDGILGQPYISDYVYDEAVTLTLRRQGSAAAAEQLGKRLRGAGEFPKAFELLHVSPAHFDEAIETFERYTDQQLSFTDATLVAQVRHHDIDTILSFDNDFAGLVDRTDPEELAPEHNP